MIATHLFVLSLNGDLLDSNPGEALIRFQALSHFFSHLTVLVLNHGVKRQPQTYGNLDIYPVNAWGKLDLLTRTYATARHIYKKHPYHLITCEDQLITSRVGKWLKAKLHLPLNIQTNSEQKSNYFKNVIIKANREAADSTINPISINLDSFYKPAHYRPVIKKFVSVGNLIPTNKYADLLDGFSQITSAYPDSTLTIIGDGPEKSTLASHIINLGLNDRIFLPGEKSPKETAALLHQHDVFIFCGQSVGWGESIIEAFSSGLPVITSPTKDGEDLLQPNTNCLVAPDTASLITCLRTLMRSPEEVYRLAKNGQQWLSTHLESTLLPHYFARQLLDNSKEK